ncbi:MAG: thrombospondin type 3 repeat-containing protein [Proteobacteria bacterium]|nr:thrombospondin type 3 repeat-containing protein [Pseudomonadota bacterium]
MVDKNGCSDVQKETDTDGDGVNDSVDTCASTPTGETVDASGCSDSQKDRDGDGVMDNVDTCPATPAGDAVKNTGCSYAQKISDWVKVAAGESSTFEIKADGSLYAWGWNKDGQLGDGTKIDKYVPTLIGRDTDWTHLVPGGLHTLAIKIDGMLYTWGDNEFSQLGNGSDWETSPVLIDANP